MALGIDAADHICTYTWLYPIINNQYTSNESVAEEIKNAPTVIPLSMGISTTINGT